MRRTERAMILLGPLLALAAAAAPARAQALVRRPYLQTVTPSSAIVVWTTDMATNGLVRHGASPDSLTQSTQHSDARTQHEVRISGLSAGTRYYYSVGTASGALAGGDSTHYFETSPSTGAPKKFRAWVVGDSGTGAGRQAQVRDAMLAFAGAHRPELFLHVGDMAYNSGTSGEFTNNFFAPYEGVLRNTVVWPAMGNHEGISADSGTETGPYYTAYVLPRAAEAGGLASGTEAYYSFDHANVHFVVLDSHDSPRTPGGAMLTWLQADLMATAQPWIVAYWHHPAYTKGNHDSDTERPLIEMRENALPILEAAGVDLVLAGHSHIYERSFLLDGAYDTPTVATGHVLDSGDGKPLGSGPYRKREGGNAHDGAVYVVAGHGGAGVSGRGNHPVMYFSEPENGSCLLDVQDNRLSLVNIRWDGALTDRFAMVKGTGLVIAAPDGGEALRAGDEFDIRWATAGSLPTVKLEMSTDDGRTWQTIADAAPNTGSYAWAVPPVEAKAALVRVSDAGSPLVNDESNAGFAITSNMPVQGSGAAQRQGVGAGEWGGGGTGSGLDGDPSCGCGVVGERRSSLALTGLGTLALLATRLRRRRGGPRAGGRYGSLQM
jgi:Calcineurin-like phosphoesterase/Purple acid Phosphatase, N-terminal domain